MTRASYDNIYRDLRHQIEDGTYPYGSFLPSQSMLVEKYGCAHNTARKALALLSRQGYCLPIHGKGVRVIWLPQDGSTPFKSGGFEENALRALLEKLQTELSVFEHCVCDARIAETTGLPEGADLIRAERISFIDGDPVIRERHLIRADAVVGITEAQAKDSIALYMENEIGIRLVTSKQTIFVECANERDRSLLKLDGHDHVVVVNMRTFDSSAEVLEFMQARHNPDYFLFHSIMLHDI